MQLEEEIPTMDLWFMWQSTTNELTGKVLSYLRSAATIFFISRSNSMCLNMKNDTHLSNICAKDYVEL